MVTHSCPSNVCLCSKSGPRFPVVSHTVLYMFFFICSVDIFEVCYIIGYYSFTFYFLISTFSQHKIVNKQK